MIQTRDDIIIITNVKKTSLKDAKSGFKFIQRFAHSSG